MASLPCAAAVERSAAAGMPESWGLPAMALSKTVTCEEAWERVTFIPPSRSTPALTWEAMDGHGR